MAISSSLRTQVAERANHQCEYCLIHEAYTIKKHEPDHIIPIKHRGGDDECNLAWACFLCNRHRGSDVAAYDLETGQLTPLFNPRMDIWSEHFQIDGGEIVALSAIGRVTILALSIDAADRVEIRSALAAEGLYP